MRFAAEISDAMRQAAPALTELIIEADIVNGPTDDDLWQSITTTAERIAASYEMPMVNKRPAIAATRAAYKACGKEPNRYRPSAEALMRRAVKGMELYRTTTVVDLINLMSMVTGHSIGAFDADRIQGDVITLGIGGHDEPYEAIGRGPLNIEGLPVWRDEAGGFGTPTSDNERTKLTADTKHLLVTVNMYGLEQPAEQILEYAVGLLEQYADARNIEYMFVKA